ncbi:zinc-dependent metalloprotease [Tessaracoccus sp. Z1128]
MEHAPILNWAIARRVASSAAGELPALSRPEAQRLAADLRVTARLAGEVAGRHLGLDSAGASDIRVVDWAGWGRAVRAMADGAVAELGLPARRPAALNALRGVGNGLVAGLAIGAVSRRMLGQYDAFTGSRALYLVAPTIVAHELSHGFVPADFRLWIALHEQTHALQFHAAPWLGDHLRGLMTRLAADDAHLLEGLAGWRSTGDVAALLTSPSARADLASLIATMTFLEGHADHVADQAGRRRIGTVAALRRAFQRPRSRSLLTRLSGSLNKDAQYRDGLAFCTAVHRARGPKGLAAAFAAPDALPGPGEIADPAAWVRRVHGAA